MNKRILTLLASIGLAGSLFAAIVGAAQPAQARPLQATGSPLTLLASNITSVFTTTPRYYGDAATMDVYLTVAGGSGNITATLQHSSNASDWISGGTLASAVLGTNGFSRTLAYGAYYRIVVNTNSSSITPTVRVVTK
jgi:hypothetical protein